MRHKEIKKIFWLSAVIINSAFLVWANQENADSLFLRANLYYEQQNYDEAIRIYERILAQGLESGNLYYNLGNCYAKKRMWGKAILNYEKAKQLIPNDKDLDYNYRYVLSFVEGNLPKVSGNIVTRLIEAVNERFSIDTLSILISILFIIFLTLVVCFRFNTSLRVYIGFIITFTLLLEVICLLALLNSKRSINQQAVVIVEKTSARFEPIVSATEYFALYEGMKVKIIDKKDNWVKIRRQDNKTGWVQTKTLEIF
ncbi:MAG: tetratricopeptide repeat protein [Candidatus Omnitrophica bacterium]|nr:tetratricopeptide repeat protein [Candidatus Omnitrophota bacterium]